MNKQSEELSVIVVGGSGNLAKKKIFPALFALYSQGLLPEKTNILGFARRELSHNEFRKQISEHLLCRYTPEASECETKTNDFLNSCHYVAGQYKEADSFLDLYQELQNVESSPETNRLFYLAIPPLIFLATSHAIGGAGFVQCGETGPWSRVVVEKPFGKDRASSDELISNLADVFVESQTYRIDHYLGKEVVQNLLVLRFANLIFEPVWNKDFIESVSITWKENLGVEGRGGYFDEYGIVRDVIQNHLLQILSLTAMCPPKDLSPASIAGEKVKVLSSIKPVELEDITLGQYKEGTLGSRTVQAYTDDETVPDDSLTPTYAEVRLQIDNNRWQGVPFIISAGKGLNKSSTEIRIKFKETENNIFCKTGQCPEANELVIRIQPDEAIYMKLTNKVPGAGMKIGTRKLDLQYKHAFNEIIADAYESLILDVINGDRSLFITKEELETSWDIFTPVLHTIDEQKIQPELYPFGADKPFANQKSL